MASAAGSASIDVSQLKQQVFTRLAFLGMPQGDVTKFVESTMELATGGAPGRAFQKDVKKLTKSLSRALGRPRADLFVKWLKDRMPNVPTSGVAATAPGQEDGATAASEQLAAPEASEPSCQELQVGKTNPQQTRSSPPMALECSQPQCSSHDDSIADEAWVKVTSKEGRTYYWDRASNSCNWELPAGIRCKWVSHKSDENRTYYSDSSGRSIWVLPPLAVKVSARNATAISNKQCSGSQPSEHGRSVSAAPKVVPVLDTPMATSCTSNAKSQAPSAEPETPVILDAKAIAHSSTKRGAPESPSRKSKVARTSEHSCYLEEDARRQAASKLKLEMGASEEAAFEYGQRMRAMAGGA